MESKLITVQDKNKSIARKLRAMGKKIKRALCEYARRPLVSGIRLGIIFQKVSL